MKYSNRTYEELERYFYITQDPQHELVQELIDIEYERNNLYWENDALKSNLELYV